MVVMMMRMNPSFLDIEGLSPFSYEEIKVIGMIILALDIVSSPKAYVTISYTFVGQDSVHTHLKIFIKRKKE